MATQTTECPVCGGTFRPSIIDEHVNSCLNKQNDVKKPSSMKRKSSDWSFFKRESQSNESENISAKSAKRLKGKAKVVSLAHITTTKSNNRFDRRVEGDSKDQTKKCCNDPDVIDVDTDSQDSDEDFKNSHNYAKNAKSCENNVDDDNTKLTLKENGPPSGSDTVTGSESNEKDSSKALCNSNSFSLFHQSNKREKIDIMKANAPLAEKLRPKNFDEFIGQIKAVGKKSLLHSLLLNSDSVPSMILWGPPGCGKTTLAKVIAHKCQQRRSAKFVSMSATSASVSDVKEVAKIAQNDLKMFRKRTILFLDEIHRFNKLQQDALLPHVENGVVTLIGATTENPSFQVNGALLSRCRVITLEKLEIEDIKTIIRRACQRIGAQIKASKGERSQDEHLGEDVEENFSVNPFNEIKTPKVVVEDAAVDALAGLVDGDARTALNGLQMTIEARLAEEGHDAESPVLITLENVKEGLQRSHVLYDRNGEEHYNIASALIKSLRGSDDNAALYWMTRMLTGGEDPLFIARRLVVFASEDVGLADPLALTQAVATFQACQFIGMPECGLNLAQCVVYLARAPKSVESYVAFSAAKELIQNQEGAMPGVPLHLRNAPTKLLKSLGCGKGYKYPPAFEGKVKQDYLPKELIGTDFFSKMKGTRPSDPDLSVQENF